MRDDRRLSTIFLPTLLALALGLLAQTGQAELLPNIQPTNVTLVESGPDTNLLTVTYPRCATIPDFDEAKYGVGSSEGAFDIEGNDQRKKSGSWCKNGVRSHNVPKSKDTIYVRIKTKLDHVGWLENLDYPIWTGPMRFDPAEPINLLHPSPYEAIEEEDTYFEQILRFLWMTNGDDGPYDVLVTQESLTPGQPEEILYEELDRSENHVLVEGIELNGRDVHLSLTYRGLSGDNSRDFVLATVDRADSDGDGVSDSRDNCVQRPNALQLDTDGDGYGNACDSDYDNDLIVDGLDWDRLQQALGADINVDPNDPRYDADLDLDGDGVIGQPESDLLDALLDGPPGPSGLTCSGSAGALDGSAPCYLAASDSDGDGWANDADNCVLVANELQADGDADGIGDACADEAGPSGLACVGTVGCCSQYHLYDAVSGACEPEEYVTIEATSACDQPVVAECPAGYQLVGGGIDTTNDQCEPDILNTEFLEGFASYPLDPADGDNGWYCRADAREVNCQAVCASVQEVGITSFVRHSPPYTGGPTCDGQNGYDPAADGYLAGHKECGSSGSPKGERLAILTCPAGTTLIGGGIESEDLWEMDANRDDWDLSADAEEYKTLGYGWENGTFVCRMKSPDHWGRCFAMCVPNEQLGTVLVESTADVETATAFCPADSRVIGGEFASCPDFGCSSSDLRIDGVSTTVDLDANAFNCSITNEQDGGDEYPSTCRAVCLTPDADGDTVPDSEDNCPDAANPSQDDLDEDGEGDACDPPTIESVSVQIDGTWVDLQEGVTLDVSNTVKLRVLASDEHGLGFPVFSAFGNESPVSYIWNFGGPIFLPRLQVFNGSPGIDYYSPGLKTVSITVFDATGLSSTETFTVNALPSDIDADGVADHLDNCVKRANSDQRDTNQDGYGNVCDMDLDDDGAVTNADYVVWNQSYGKPPTDPAFDPDADFNGDGAVDIDDFWFFHGPNGYNKAVGPSGHECAGTAPCP